ncbi:hypothetical protein M1N54_03930, partial [Thermodesulfovibrionales bacterium]|nr:hypothetical protein [Thermodesulfovibrionales bacterium]
GRDCHALRAHNDIFILLCVLKAHVGFFYSIAQIKKPPFTTKFGEEPVFLSLFTVYFSSLLDYMSDQMLR